MKHIDEWNDIINFLKYDMQEVNIEHIYRVCGCSRPKMAKMEELIDLEDFECVCEQCVAEYFGFENGNNNR